MDAKRVGSPERFTTLIADMVPFVRMGFEVCTEMTVLREATIANLALMTSDSLVVNLMFLEG